VKSQTARNGASLLPNSSHTILFDPIFHANARGQRHGTNGEHQSNLRAWSLSPTLHHQQRRLV